MRRLAVALPLAFMISAACAVTAPSTALDPTSAASRATLKLPQPIAQKITRIGAAAQNAWLTQLDGGGANSPVLIGVDPSGQLIGKVDLGPLQTARVTRSANGAELWVIGPDAVTVFSAFDGKRLRSYDMPSAVVVESAFSDDGKWFAQLVRGAAVRVLDITTGAIETIPVPHDQKANLPGLSGDIASVLWGTLTFARDSMALYAITDWAGPTSVTAISFDGTQWKQTASLTSGAAGLQLPTCAGPALALRAMNGQQTLTAFCHVDGAVWLFENLAIARTTATVLRPEQKNPFWLSPIFTPDGQLLYLHNPPAFGDTMQVVDIAAKRLAGPVATPTKVGAPGPFAWSVGVAAAGGVASTMPVSPDSRFLYSATPDGVMVLRIPDLAAVRKLGPGVNADEVWVSGDGHTVYAKTAGALVVLREDGAGQTSVPIGRNIGAFIASEHG